MRALSLSESSLYPSACVRFCARAKEIRARAKEIRTRAGRFARKQGNPRESKGNPRASREIRAQAGRFALAHYINLLSRYKNVLSTFGSKITPYSLVYQKYNCRVFLLSTSIYKCMYLFQIHFSVCDHNHR